MLIPSPIHTSAPKLIRLYKRLLQWLCLPLLLHSFFHPDLGRNGVSFLDKCFLLWKFIRNTRRIHTVSSWYEHFLMAQAILSLPKKTRGVVVECGAFKGGSTANLSLVCKLVGRRLVVFDSFSGLPSPGLADRRHHCPALGEIHTYAKGAFRGRLAEVKRNLKAYGSLEVCEFIPGYFKTTLPKFTKRRHKVVCVFADVDLRQSLETCLRYLWPKLVKGGYFFTHEAQHQEIAQVFFDQDWWQKHLHQSPPGLIGAGLGLQVGLQPTALGYTIKSPPSYRIKPQLR